MKGIVDGLYFNPGDSFIFQAILIGAPLFALGLARILITKKQLSAYYIKVCDYFFQTFYK